MTGVNAVVLIKAETSLINELAEQLAELPASTIWWRSCACARTTSLQT